MRMLNLGARARDRVTHLKRNTRCRASAAEQANLQRNLAPLMDTLQRDSPKLFSEDGMDLSIYSDDVDFQDPITNYDSIQGFIKNLAFLKRSFDPTYEMLDIRQLNDTDIEARWTMGFDVLPIKRSPVGKWWQPRMEFTGTTIYGVDPDTGLIDRHIDTWDSVNNSRYFSVEAFMDVLSQIFNFQRTPGLPTPSFTLLKCDPSAARQQALCLATAPVDERRADYSVRRYDPFVVAETGRPGPTGGDGGTASFRTLARYIFGGNDTETKLSMTTPVLSGGGKLQFVLPISNVSDAPPHGEGANVSVRRLAGGTFAALRFSGRVTPQIVAQRESELRAALARDGVQAAGPDEEAASPNTLLLQYNDPSVKGPFRRNEVIVRIENFDIWA